MGSLYYLALAAYAGVASLTATIVYRLHLHPLAKIPGPRLAAISRFYEWYFDCIQSGVYYRKIQEWHRKYGSIIRIGPNEVHVDDPEWFDTLYSSSVKLDKDPWYYGFLGSYDSAFAATDYDAHRIKRHKQNAFFSRQTVDKGAPILSKVLGNMLDRFEEYRGTNRPLRIRNALKSYSADMVCEYCFPGSMEFVKAPNFSEMFHYGNENFDRMFPWFRHFPLLAKFIFALPESILSYASKEIRAVTSFIMFIEQQVEESIQSTEEKRPSDKRTIIRELYTSDMPPSFRTQLVLEQEATALVAAGTSTSARLLECGIFHILQNPTVVKRLTEEVRAYKPGEVARSLTHRELEAVPYLNAVVLECQRMIPALLSRFPRINRSEDMLYQGHALPKGTVIGMSIWDMLLSDQIWGNAHEFNPSRWLDSDYRAKMQKYMIPFGRGSRNCVGQNLATAEMYTVFGNLFRRFDLELYETTEKEVEVVQDCFVALPYKGSLGVQILLQ